VQIQPIVLLIHAIANSLFTRNAAKVFSFRQLPFFTIRIAVVLTGNIIDRK